MIKTIQPTVALVEWNWVSHHPMYFRKLISGFLASGARVLAMCPAQAIPEMREWLEAQPNSRELHDFVDFHPVQNVHGMGRLPRFLRERIQGRKMFGQIAASLGQWEQQTGHKIGLVFFATIIDVAFENFHHAKNLFRYPWSGIYMESRAFRLPGTMIPFSNSLPCPEKIFTLPSMSSVCVLDETVVAPMHALSGGKPIFAFPDVTETVTEESSNSHTLAEKIQRFANGRKIVVCMGFLHKTKGLLELSLAAKDKRLQDVCFFFGGEVGSSTMSRDEVKTITETWERSPNVMTHLTRLNSEATFNSIMHAADVVFAAYTNFPGSSNIMTKAACFKRPIIVSDGFLMAERVRKYQTGKIVPEGDVDAIVEAIAELVTNPPSDGSGHAEYYESHTDEKLTAIIKKILDAAPN